jgi:hypothetical protein
LRRNAKRAEKQEKAFAYALNNGYNERPFNERGLAANKAAGIVTVAASIVTLVIFHCL